jgi:cell division protein FtsB
MNVDLGIWGKLTRVVIFLFALAGVLMVALWYLPLIRQNERMRKVILQQDANLQQEKETNKQLKATIETLQTDPKAMERLVRERLGYGKPGEILVRYEEPATNQPVAH